ncbi:hypothetical protein LMG24238_02246 [Paraburkholderia sediminicola]|uniref:Uncharacterized protein n=1 Tax=Paraburkholderia sediminicola TaxID=458836 RepID=A0A6J5AKV2_9BURK|nr:hypothetical protein LMG24238_02246 [Paraburkholderia sediminicola]
MVPFLKTAQSAGCKTPNGVQMIDAVQEMMLDFLLDQKICQSAWRSYSSCGGTLMSTNHNTAKMIKKGIERTLSLPVEMTQRIAITAADRCFHRFRCLTLHDFHGLHILETQRRTLYSYRGNEA